MKFERLFFHPVLNNKKGLALFIGYLFFSSLVGGFLYWDLQKLLTLANINVNNPDIQLNLLEKFVLSPYVRLVLIPMLAVVSTSITASHIKGPLQRIENWLQCVIKGLHVEKLVVRKNDKFVYLVALLNEFHSHIDWGKEKEKKNP